MSVLRIAITPGEPAGIGPDICLQLSQLNWPCELVFIADKSMLVSRAQTLGLTLKFQTASTKHAPKKHIKNVVSVLNVPLDTIESPGTLDRNNANYVLNTLATAVDLCLNNNCQALVTGPVQKSIINDAGIDFSGHTEFLAAHCDAAHPVMMLVANQLRVALATTHLPLRQVSETLTQKLLHKTITILNQGLIKRFCIDKPRIAICGLNPHAGEGGHLGKEEGTIIEPVIESLKQQGLRLTGPLPADTAFTPPILQQHDAILAMYHDQGLPTLKYAGFGDAINVTLGLPIIRTSVDHGTALPLAGSGKAKSSSLKAALKLAIELANQSKLT
ncbi:MAG: 4-hydroxythreonine-4-phosphate dehydrogenase PdxA [Cycloclasticus sp. symbiont of Poecilosclerida sp. M]|nr:MAG: 4-hydroxythreonine-4-phosphate dehydrogenase PdxA [Cycloclasticus sp. symbiont of Poecilosclerida sp. M]